MTENINEDRHRRVNAGRHVAQPTWRQANRAEVSMWIGVGVASTLIVGILALLAFVLVTP